MPFELFLALRYLRDGRLQTLLILTGIGVGVGVIVFLSALITGLQADLIERTLGTQALVVVSPPEEMPRRLDANDGTLEIFEVERPPQRVRSIPEWQEVLELLRGMPDVVAVTPSVNGPGLARRGGGAVSVTLRGIEPRSFQRLLDLEGRLVGGALELEGFRAVVGVGLAEILGVGLGDRVLLQVAEDRQGVYTVAGVFDFGSTELNEGLVFVSIRSAQALFGLPGGVSLIELRNRDIFDADRLADRISARTGLEAESWIDRNRDLLVGLRSQSMSSVMIQFFVIVAVALGIASVLTVSVVQRAPEVGILRATGTRTRAIVRVFLVQGAILGVVGSLAGIVLGTLLAFLFQGIARGPDGTALFPVSLTATLYVRSVAIALVVGILAAVVPARRAAATDPALVIRDA
jgi:lipoprotein-releasing system permease protein